MVTFTQPQDTELNEISFSNGLTCFLNTLGQSKFKYQSDSITYPKQIFSALFELSCYTFRLELTCSLVRAFCVHRDK